MLSHISREENQGRLTLHRGNWSGTPRNPGFLSLRTNLKKACIASFFPANEHSSRVCPASQGSLFIGFFLFHRSQRWSWHSNIWSWCWGLSWLWCWSRSRTWRYPSPWALVPPLRSWGRRSSDSSLAGCWGVDVGFDVLGKREISLTAFNG